MATTLAAKYAAAKQSALTANPALAGLNSPDGTPVPGMFPYSLLRAWGPQNAQAGTTYTLVLADSYGWVSSAHASGCTITVPPNSSVAFPVGAVIPFIVLTGAGDITFAQGSGVTIVSTGSVKVTNGAGSLVWLKKTATNTWYLAGDLNLGVQITSLTENTAPDGTEEFITGDGERLVLDTITRYMNGVLTEFGPYDNVPPTSNFATLDTRNSHPVLDFDGATNESAVFSGRLGSQYTGNGVTVDLYVSHTSDITNDTDWDVAFERIGAGVLDIDADSFATVNSTDNTTVPGTAGFVQVISVTFTDGADMDSVAAGEQFRLKVTRDAASDTSTTDAELHRVVVRETA